jgi:hypothetical protein
MNGQTNIFIDASAGMCTNLKMHCFCHFSGWTDYNPDIFLLGPLILTVTMIYMILNPIRKFFQTHFDTSLRVFENRILRRIFGPKREGII